MKRPAWRRCSTASPPSHAADHPFYRFHNVCIIVADRGFNTQRALAVPLYRYGVVGIMPWVNDHAHLGVPWGENRVPYCSHLNAAANTSKSSELEARLRRPSCC